MPDYVISARQSLGTVQLPGGSADSQLARAARDAALAAQEAAEGAQDLAEAAAGNTAADAIATAADRVQTGLDAATATTGAGTATTQAGTATTKAGEAAASAGTALAQAAIATAEADEAIAQSAASAVSAASALAILLSIEGVVANATIHRDTLTALNLVTPTLHALATVENDGTNNGTYLGSGSAWVRVSAVTLTMMANLLYQAGSDQRVDVVPIVSIGLAANDSTYAGIWVYPTGHASAGKLDMLMSDEMKAAATILISDDVTASKAITDLMSVSALTDGPDLIAHFRIPDTAGEDWTPLAVLGPSWGDDAGKLLLNISSVTLAEIGGPQPVPTSLFTDVEAGGVIQRLYSEDEGWPEEYHIRSDLLPVTIAMAVSARRAVLIGMTGQSNSIGTNAPVAQSAVTTTAPNTHRAFTLNTGPRISNGGALIDGSAYTGLIPLVETNTIGETPISSMARWLMAQDEAESIAPQIYIGETHGVGGYYFSQIQQGTNVYTNGLMALGKMVRFARLHGAVGVWQPVHNMDQGEADRTGTPTPRGDYVTMGLQFQADNEADIRAVTRQPEPVWWVMMQTSAGCGTANSRGAYTALPQHDLMLQAPRTTLCGPFYFLKGAYGFSAANGLHFTPTGHALRGEYQAKANDIIQRAIERATAQGADPWALTIADIRTCLRPDLANVSRLGAVITIPLILPADGTAVVLDTVTLPDPGNYGFRKTAGAGGAISSVALVGNSIEVTLASAGGATLAYADEVMDNTTTDRSCAWGNFRDDCDKDSLAVPGLKLRNWLVTFDVVVA